MVTDILKVLWYMQDCHCNPYSANNTSNTSPSIVAQDTNQTCATRYVIRILVINAKQRQQTGKQNFPKCGAVSGFSLQNGIFPKFSFIYLIGFIFINKGELYAIHFISHHCHFSNLCIM